MKDIKPIETVFDGHRFRSRLEARWAVFFKSLELAYDYEAEGYELGNGVRYLPDFYLPALDVHVEVKPKHELTRNDIEKIVRFAVDGDKPLLLFVGTPGEDFMYLVDRACCDTWPLCDADEDDEMVRALFWEAIMPWSSVMLSRLPRTSEWAIVFRKQPPLLEARMDTARAVARQARFEHGRSGN